LGHLTESSAGPSDSRTSESARRSSLARLVLTGAPQSEQNLASVVSPAPHCSQNAICSPVFFVFSCPGLATFSASFRRTRGELLHLRKLLRTSVRRVSSLLCALGVLKQYVSSAYPHLGANPTTERVFTQLQLLDYYWLASPEHPLARLFTQRAIFGTERAAIGDVFPLRDPGRAAPAEEARLQS
jgi:hypothetical protein